MKTNFCKIILSSLFMVASASPVIAMAAPTTAMDKDPARWYVEDMTPQAKAATLRKEAGAALQEAKSECKRMAANGRNACMRDATAIYQADMAAANRVSRR